MLRVVFTRQCETGKGVSYRKTNANRVSINYDRDICIDREPYAIYYNDGSGGHWEIITDHHRPKYWFYKVDIIDA